MSTIEATLKSIELKFEDMKRLGTYEEQLIEGNKIRRDLLVVLEGGHVPGFHSLYEDSVIERGYTIPQILPPIAEHRVLGEVSNKMINMQLRACHAATVVLEEVCLSLQFFNSHTPKITFEIDVIYGYQAERE